MQYTTAAAAATTTTENLISLTLSKWTSFSVSGNDLQEYDGVIIRDLIEVRDTAF